MGLIASSSGGGDFEVVPIGTHRAICYKLADAGTRDEKFKDEDAKKRHTIFIFFELPDLRTSKDQPFSIFKQYTLSLNENSALHSDSSQGHRLSPEEEAGSILQVRTVSTGRTDQRENSDLSSMAPLRGCGVVVRGGRFVPWRGARRREAM